jgi:hypothetical protein
MLGTRRDVVVHSNPAFTGCGRTNWRLRRLGYAYQGKTLQGCRKKWARRPRPDKIVNMTNSCQPPGPPGGREPERAVAPPVHSPDVPKATGQRLHRMDRCSACNVVSWHSTFHTEHVTRQLAKPNRSQPKTRQPGGADSDSKKMQHSMESRNPEIQDLTRRVPCNKFEHPLLDQATSSTGTFSSSSGPPNFATLRSLRSLHPFPTLVHSLPLLHDTPLR